MTTLLLAAVLHYDLTPGFTRTYEVERTYKSLDGTETTGFVDKVTFVVTKDKIEDRTKVKMLFRPLKTILDGQTFPSSADTPIERTEERNARGEAYQRQLMPYDTALRERQNRIADVVFPLEPVQEGMVWTRNVPAIEDMFPAAEWTWTCTALTPQFADLQLSFAETSDRGPITAKGTIRIDVKSGWPEEIRYSIPETKTPGDSEPVVVSLNVVWKRVA